MAGVNIEVYGPTHWDLTKFHEDPRRSILLQWMRANDIEPENTPVEQIITVAGNPRTIRYTAYVTNDAGQKIVVGNSPVFEARVTPLKVAVPDRLMPPGGDDDGRT